MTNILSKLDIISQKANPKTTYRRWDAKTLLRYPDILQIKQRQTTSHVYDVGCNIGASSCDHLTPITFTVKWILEKTFQYAKPCHIVLSKCQPVPVVNVANAAGCRRLGVTWVSVMWFDSCLLSLVSEGGQDHITDCKLNSVVYAGVGVVNLNLSCLDLQILGPKPPIQFPTGEQKEITQTIILTPSRPVGYLTHYCQAEKRKPPRFYVFGVTRSRTL